MGEREQAPPMPAIEATLLSEAEVTITFTQRECNWLQALEGDIDTSHFSWLHVGSVTPEQVQDDNWVKYQVQHRAPDYEVTDTDWGTMYCAMRPAEDDKTYWRFAHFGFPFWTFIPQGHVRGSRDRARLGADGRHARDVRGA
jgi:phthalate 4,5-dioxygenase oxygenase subunit